MGTRMPKEGRVEMGMGQWEEEGEGERDTFLQVHMEIQMPEPQIEIEDWVGVHSLKNMPKSFKPQESCTLDYSPLVDCIRAQQWTKTTVDDSCSKNGNQMTTLFCSPEGDENQKVLKHLFKKLKKYHSKFYHCPRYTIILVDAKNSDTLKQSFKTVVEILDRKVDTKKLSIVKKMYKKMNSQSSRKDQSLVVFVGAGSCSEITQFLPKKDVVLPFSQFLLSTSSKTVNWITNSTSESDSGSEKWANKNFLMFDKELLEFDWEGVHSALKIPASFQPVPDFSGRAEIMSQLVQRIKNNPPVLKTVQNFNPSAGDDKVQMDSQISSVKSPTPRTASLTVISGVKGNGKTELVKKFLWSHPHLVAKVVLIDAENLWLPLKIFAHNFGIYSESAIEGTTESDKIASLHSEITKNLQGNQRVLFLFDNADSLEKIKNYLPKKSKSDEVIYHVIVTSRSRNWEKEEDVEFYGDNGYDFQEIPLFDGLRLDETHEFCSKLLPQHRICYLRADLERSIRELHKLTGGFPLTLPRFTTSVTKSSRSNPEWAPNIHILNYLRRDFQEFRHEIKPFDWNPRFEFSIGRRSLVSTTNRSEFRLLQILCLMNPNHLDFHMICYFYLEFENPFKPPPQQYEAEQVNNVEEMLRTLEIDSLIQVDRSFEDGKVKTVRVRVPAFLRESMNAEKADTRDCFRNFLYGAKRPHSSWTRPLDVPELWPHILSLNESYTRCYGYHNQVLIECIQNHLGFWKNPPKKAIPGEQRPNTDFKQEKEKIKELFDKNPIIKRTFGDFSQVENPGFLIPFLSLIIFAVDVGSDLNNARVMYNAEYYAHFGLSLFLVGFPFTILCLLHYFDRTEYNRKMKNRRRMSLWNFLTAMTGTFHSYFLRLWYIWKFRREKGNLEKGLLYERLCALRANAEYHGIAEAFMESLPQLLLQFPLYLLSYTSGYSNLRDVMRGDSWFPYQFELGLVISLFVFGLALTKVESVYFGWNMDIFGIKLLVYRIIHLLINVTHVATLVFCSGIVSVVFPWFMFVIPLVFNITAIVWIQCDSDAEEFSSIFCSSFQPGFVEKWKKLEASLKHEFVSEKLGHDILFLLRRPKNRDIIYLFLLLSSVFISACTCIYLNLDPQFSTILNEIAAEYKLRFLVIEKHTYFFILWLPVLFLWQVLRQLLNVVYLKCFKIPPLTEDYILNDPEGIFRHPADSERLIQLRLYYQMRTNQPSVFTQVWTQLKQTLRKFHRNKIRTKLKILLLFPFKLIFKSLYFLFIALLLYFVLLNLSHLTEHVPN